MSYHPLSINPIHLSRSLTPCLSSLTPSHGPLVTSAEAPNEPVYPKILVNDRLVSTKPANQPFLKYARDQEQRTKLLAERRASADLQAAQRAAKIAAGEPVDDDNLAWGSAIWKVLKVVVMVLIVASSAGKMFTGSPVWGQEDAIVKVWTTKINPVRESSYLTTFRLLFDSALDMHKGKSWRCYSRSRGEANLNRYLPCLLVSD